MAGRPAKAPAGRRITIRLGVEAQEALSRLMSGGLTITEAIERVLIDAAASPARGRRSGVT